jgi:hypothetical protein
MLAAAAFLLPAISVQAQPAAPAASLGDRAGLRLPVQLCAMRQERLDTSPNRLDATYSLPGDGTLRVSVARAAQSVDGEFIDIEAAIRDYFGDIVLLRELGPPAGIAEARGRLWRGMLETRRVMTGLWLWHHDGLRIKLRGTVPLGEAGRMWPEIECATRALVAPPAA